MNVPLCRPPVDGNDVHAVLRVLESGMLVQGSHVRELEDRVAHLVGVRHAIALSSGTATLHLALLSLGVGPGDEVVIPAFSHVATANVVELTGARPVFVDIEPESFNIDPEKIAASLTGKTKVIMPVHEFGRPAAREAIQIIAEENNLAIVEDAACALGSCWHDGKVGAWGIASSFSLHPRKVITSGEGGILTTDDDDLAAFYRAMRNHGMDEREDKPTFMVAGFNYRMTDIQAALATGQLKRLESIINRRAIMAERYKRELTGHCFRKPEAPESGRTNWQSYHIVLDGGVQQAHFLSFLAEREIGANYGAQCIPVQPFYRDKYGYAEADFPEAYRAFTQGVVLPLFDTMTEDQQSFVIETVNNYRSI